MRRLVFCFLLALVGAAPAYAGDALSPAQTKAVERIVHDYLIKHPEVLMEAMQAADDKDKAAKQVATAQTLRTRHSDIYNDPDALVGGNPKGDVTLVEFFDYRCPYCKQVQPSIERLLKTDRDLRVVYKEFPILGPASVFASQMALAARNQGKYLPFHQAMMDTKGSIDDEIVLRVAAGVGIDVAKAKVDMRAPAVAAVIKKDYALADALDINGTPAFIVDGKLIPGAIDIDELKKLIADARQAHSG